MEHWGWLQRMRYGTVQVLGLGFIAGALETMGLAASLKLPLGVLDFALLSIGCLASTTLLAGFFGLLSGWPVHVGWSDKPAYKSISLHFGVVGGMLCAWYLLQGAYTIYAQGQPVGAAAMAAMPVGFVGVIYFNARFWVRRVELNQAPKVGWLPISLGFALVLCLGASILYPMRDTGGGYALEGDKNVLIVSIDGVRRDQIDFDAGGWKAWGDGGITFADAVSPAPAAAPAAATVLTGLHPLRHKVIFETDDLYLGYRTLGDALEAEGWATGAFVSSRAVRSELGLSQGFRIYDDNFSPILPGLTRVNLLGHIANGLLAVSGPETLMSLRGRDAGGTVDRFSTWLGAHAEVPFFGWVHLAGGDVDAALIEIRGLLTDAGVMDRTLVIIAGSYGERGVGEAALHDPAVRVPIVIHAPGVRIDVPVVEPQVRLMDIAATVLDFLQLDVLGETEGITLIGYGQGLRKATVWCSLVSDDGRGKAILGMRNNGIKYIREASGAEHVYDLRADPGEADDLAGEQESTVVKARTLLAGEDVALEKILRER